MTKGLGGVGVDAVSSGTFSEVTGLVSPMALLAHRNGELVVTAIAMMRFSDVRRRVEGNLLAAVAAVLVEYGDTEPVACA